MGKTTSPTSLNVFFAAQNVFIKAFYGEALSDDEASLRDAYISAIDNYDVIAEKNGICPIPTEVGKWLFAWGVTDPKDRAEKACVEAVSTARAAYTKIGYNPEKIWFGKADHEWLRVFWQAQRILHKYYSRKGGFFDHEETVLREAFLATIENYDVILRKSGKSLSTEIGKWLSVWDVDKNGGGPAAACKKVGKEAVKSYRQLKLESDWVEPFG